MELFSFGLLYLYLSLQTRIYFLGFLFVFADVVAFCCLIVNSCVTILSSVALRPVKRVMK